MHPILAAITGKSAVSNWRSHFRDVNKSMKKLEAFGQRTQKGPESIGTTQDAFFKNPTEENFQKWLEVESHRVAMLSLTQAIYARIISIREAKQAAGGSAKLHAVADEIEGELKARRAAIVAEDEKRSQEQGEVVESKAALEKIKKMHASLEEARANAEHRFDMAASIIHTILGPDPEEA